VRGRGELKGKPVKVVWTREDDIRGGFYRPMYVHRVEVGLDAQNKIVAGTTRSSVRPSSAARPSRQ
jgi:isoquinoline 1-oxidoreductase beta subunit